MQSLFLSRRGASLLFAFAMFALMPALHAQETMSTNRATELRANPDDAAASLQAVPAQTTVQVLERRGAWTRVKTDSQSGWLRLMHLRGSVTVGEAPQQTKSGGFLSGLNRALGGGQGSQRAQSATLGIRGLSPEELKSASPNPQALAQTRAFAASKSEAEQHAKAASLARVDVTDPAESGKGAR